MNSLSKSRIKVIIISLIILMGAVIAGLCTYDWEWNTYCKDYEYVTNCVNELSETEVFNNSTDEEKYVLMKNTFDDLKEQGKIKDYCSSNSDSILNIWFNNGVHCGFVVKETHQDTCWGNSTSQLKQSTESKSNLVDKFFKILKRYDWQIIFGDETEDNSTYNELKALANEYGDGEINNINLITNTTVSTYSELDSKELIYINAHGFFDEGIGLPVIWTQEEATEQKNKDYRKLLKNDSICIYKMNSNNKYYYVILPSFFENYYKDDDLKDSIVFLGVCEALGKNNNECYTIFESLKNAGASTMIGFCNSVNQGYSVLFYSSVINNFLSGQTIGESFDIAKNTVGNNENEYFNTYNDFEAVEFPAYPILKGDAEKKYKFSDLISYGKCSFTVKDSVSKDNIENASVTIYNESVSISTRVYKTDKNGFCQIQLPVGKYNCNVQCKSYKEEKFEININDNAYNELSDPVLLTPQRNNITDFINMSYSEICNLFGKDNVIAEGGGWIPTTPSDERIVGYLSNNIPLEFMIFTGRETPLTPYDNDKVTDVRFTTSKANEVYSVDGNVTTDVTWSVLQEKTNGKKWIDGQYYVYSYKVGELSVDFEYENIPDETKVADYIYVSKRNWEPEEENWANYTPYQPIIERYRSECEQNHGYNSNIYCCTWFLFDVDNNGTDELIILDQEGGAEQARYHHYFTISNGKVIELGEYSAWHMGLYENDGELYGKVVSPNGPTEYYKMVLSDNKIKTELVKSIDKSSDDGGYPPYTNPITSVDTMDISYDIYEWQ